MFHPSGPQRVRFTWRSFLAAHGRQIDHQLRWGAPPSCPGCGAILEARSNTRVRAQLPLDACGYDLDCRGCRQFWAVVRHGPRSIRLVRMRRMVAAISAVDARIPARAAIA